MDRIANVGDVDADDMMDGPEDAIIEEDEEDRGSDGKLEASALNKKEDGESEEVRAAVEAFLKKRKRKLKQSGCLMAMYIDPDVSDDDEDNPVKRMRKKEEVANTAKILKEKKS